jgi:peptide deformylase
VEVQKVAQLNILTDENPRLRLKSQKVTKFDKSLRELAQNMFETLENANGVGLAAPQVGVLQRLLVIDVPKDLEYEGSEPFRIAIVNPEIIKCGGEQVGEEGCLSIPGWYGDVKRYDFITVRGQDVYGKPVRLKLEAFPARVMQHEVDHLDGILFTDKLVDAASLHHVTQEDQKKSETQELVKSI